MEEMTLEEKMDYVLEHSGTNAEFVNGALTIGGWNIKTLDAIVYYETGYQTFKDWYKEKVANNE